MHTNKGHRQRVKERFRTEGLDNFDQVHALELLLFYAVPQRDTKPLARRLLDRFGSYSKVMEASREALMQVEGVGINVATYLNLIHASNRYYQIKRNSTDTVLLDINECGRFLTGYFDGMRNELLYLLCLDAKCKVLCCKKLGEGSVNSLNISPRNIVELALALNATSVILAHNHPGGLATPSGEDVFTTKRIAAALSSVEIKLVDHIVVADGEFTSMTQSGLYDPDEKILFL